MQRGVLQLSRAELNALTKSFDMSKYQGMPLINKIEAGIKANTDPISLELSEEELEILMDEAGIPVQGELPEMVGVRTKMNGLMSTFRNAF